MVGLRDTRPQLAPEMYSGSSSSPPAYVEGNFAIIELAKADHRAGPRYDRVRSPFSVAHSPVGEGRLAPIMRSRFTIPTAWKPIAHTVSSPVTARRCATQSPTLRPPATRTRKRAIHPCARSPQDEIMRSFERATRGTGRSATFHVTETLGRPTRRLYPRRRVPRAPEPGRPGRIVPRKTKPPTPQ